MLPVGGGRVDHVYGTDTLRVEPELDRDVAPSTTRTPITADK